MIYSWYIMGLAGPAMVFELIETVAQGYTRGASFSSRRIKKNEVEIVVVPKKEVREKPYRCKSRMGYFEAIPLLFDYPLPRIEHPSCIFKGASHCRYILRWQNSPTESWRRLRNVFFVLSIPTIILFRSFLSPGAFCLVHLGLVGSLLLIARHSAGFTRRKLFSSIKKLRATSKRLLQYEGTSYNNARMINEIGQTISKSTHIDSILEGVASGPHGGGCLSGVFGHRCVGGFGKKLVETEDWTELKILLSVPPAKGSMNPWAAKNSPGR